MTKLLRGDFGTSLQHQQPAMGLVIERLPASILLAVSALVLAVALAVPLGIAAAARRGTALDHLAVGLAALGQSAPIFWTGLMLMLVLSVTLKLLPTTGYGTWQHLVMPALTLASYPDGGDGTARAVGDARGARRRLRPHRAGQGAPRARRSS